MAAGTGHRLADGRLVALRPAGPADVPAITRLYLGLSPESFSRRFHSGRPAPEMVAQLAGLGPRTFCLVVTPARVDRPPAGVDSPLGGLDGPPGGPDGLTAADRLAADRLAAERPAAERPAAERPAADRPEPDGLAAAVGLVPERLAADELAAEGRYVPTGDGTAELGLAVRDSYQGAGLGHLLLDALVQQARRDGLARLRAVILLGNAPMLRLLQRHGCVLAAETEDYQVAYLEIATDGGMPGWPPGSEGRRVLVERRGWFDDERVAALRTAGEDVRQCAGPSRQAGRVCPLLSSGTCRLAEEADLIVSALPDGEPDCAAVAAAHRRRWPGKLAP
jgi:GNAT superfamily N-acetyltransferase